jgi:hypothetical protein
MIDGDTAAVTHDADHERIVTANVIGRNPSGPLRYG